MKTNDIVRTRHFNLPSARSFSLALFFLLLLFAFKANAQVAVIAHPSVPAEQLDVATLLDYYSGDIKEWPNGQKVIVYDLKNPKTIKDTFYKYLGKSSSRMKSIWMKKMLAGEGVPPQALDDEEKMLQMVAETPGAIGFISTEKVKNIVKLVATFEGG